MKYFLDIKNFYIFIFIFSLLSLLVVLYIEFFLGYQPCKLCIYQRIPYLIAIFFTFLGISYYKNLTWLDNKCFSIKKTEDEFYLLRFRKRSFVVKISNERLISQIARLISVLELFPNKIRVAGNRLFFDLTFPSRVIMRRILEYGG